MSAAGSQTRNALAGMNCDSERVHSRQQSLDDVKPKNGRRRLWILTGTNNRFALTIGRLNAFGVLSFCRILIVTFATLLVGNVCGAWIGRDGWQWAVAVAEGDAGLGMYSTWSCKQCFIQRAQRPSLGSAWEPFYSSSPSLSAHSTASITSLQGKTPLPGHPKTLRDLTHITELLTLPSSFGAIQLGETFSSCLSINNDASVEVEGVTVRVEMQTASSKALLAEFGGPGQRLIVGQSLERVVSHEIKELGQHVLGCTVSYRMPPGMRPPPGQTESQEPGVQSFRKFYKFAVSTHPTG